jgi:hypothetical protein
MKKIILIAATAIAAQTAGAQISISPEAGINIANVTNKISDTKLSSKSITGFRVGANVDIPIGAGFSVQPGLFYSMKGTKYTGSFLTISGENKISMQYLEVPVNVVYRYDFGNAGGIFASVGPYAGYAIGGKAKVEITGLASTEEDIKFGSDAGEFKPFDYGINFGLGYISPFGLYVRGQYGLGLANLSNADNVTWKNKVISVSLGYAFTIGGN